MESSHFTEIRHFSISVIRKLQPWPWRANIIPSLDSTWSKTCKYIVKLSTGCWDMTFYIVKCIRLNLTPSCHGNAFSPIPLLGRPTLDGKALSFTHERSLFFYHFTMLSSHAVNGHQMYSRGLVVGKASIIGINISPTFPLFSHGSKNAKFGVVFNITDIWVVRVWKCSNISRVVRRLRQKMKIPRTIFVNSAQILCTLSNRIFRFKIISCIAV